MPSTNTIILAVAVFLLAYLFNSPLPAHITDPWKLKTIIGGYRLINLITTLGVSVGYDSELNFSRSLFPQVFKFASKPVHSHGIQVEYTDVGGVPVQIFSPSNREPEELLPVVVYFHGGGFFTFSVGTYEYILKQLSQDTRTIVVAPEYRLAPEHPFPAPLDDCYAVARAVLKDASKYGGNVRRVALAGDSAGGNLAAAVAWRLANTPTPDKLSPPKLQILLYPMIQAFDFQLPSYVHLNGITHEVVTSEGFAAAWSMYCTGKVLDVHGILSNQHTTDDLKKSKYAKYLDKANLPFLDLKQRKQPLESGTCDPSLAKELEVCITNPEFSPLMADDMTIFPKTYLMSAEYDILRDECFLFEKRLHKAGVDVHHNYVRGGWHGIVSYTKTEGGEVALRNVVDFIKGNL